MSSDNSSGAGEERGASARDAAWMKAIVENRDEQALGRIVETYGPSLKGWLMRRGLGEANAEDLLQDVMVRVWTKAALYDPEKAALSTWLFRLTRNRLIDHQRKHGRVDVRDPELMKTVVKDTVPSAEFTVFEAESHDRLRKAMDELPEENRVLIEMAFMNFMTHQEIADETGLALGTVKSRIRAGISRLKHILKARL